MGCVGQYSIVCLYDEILGQMGECAYSVNCLYDRMCLYSGMCLYGGMCPYSRMVQVRYLRPLAMFDTWVGTRNRVSIWHMSGHTYFTTKFRLANKGLVIDENCNCSANYVTIRATTCPQHNANPLCFHMLSYNGRECSHPRLDLGCLIAFVYDSDKVRVGLLCLLCILYESWLRPTMPLYDRGTVGGPLWQPLFASSCISDSYDIVIKILG